jgi:hypothetical protein
MTVLFSYVTVLISIKDCFLEQDAARPPTTQNVLNFQRKRLETECSQTDSLFFNFNFMDCILLCIHNS